MKNNKIWLLDQLSKPLFLKFKCVLPDSKWGYLWSVWPHARQEKLCPFMGERKMGLHCLCVLTLSLSPSLGSSITKTFRIFLCVTQRWKSHSKGGKMVHEVKSSLFCCCYLLRRVGWGGRKDFLKALGRFLPSFQRPVLLTYIGRERGRVWEGGGVYSDSKCGSGAPTSFMLNYGPLLRLNTALTCVMDSFLYKPAPVHETR